MRFIGEITFNYDITTKNFNKFTKSDALIADIAR